MQRLLESTPLSLEDSHVEEVRGGFDAAEQVRARVMGTSPMAYRRVFGRAGRRGRDGRRRVPSEGASEAAENDGGLGSQTML